MYKNQPLVYVSSTADQSAIEGIQGYDPNKVAIFNGEANTIKTHNHTFYCVDWSSDISTINGNITSIANRISNLEGGNLDSRVSALEALMDQLFPMDGNDENNRADFIDQLYAAITELQTQQNAVITTINNNIAAVEFWYTEENSQAQIQ